jgi:hypothetical protein
VVHVGADLIAGRNVPQARTVRGPGQDAAHVLAEDRSIDPATVLHGGTYLLAGRALP